MTPNPFNDLLHSRRFWLLVLDAVVSLVTMGLNTYASPDTQKFVLAIVATLQPVVIMVIGAITAQTVTQIKATGTEKPPTDK